MNWPDRKFCLLEVLQGGDGALAPEEFVFDPNAFYKFTNRDRGDVFFQNDWFDLCDLYNLGPGSAIASYVFVDDDDVEASLELFMRRLDDNVIRIIEAMDGGDGNWIAPFDRTFMTE